MPIKRFLDLVLSAIILMVLSPLILAIALAVWADSGLPIFYRQKRVGRRFCSFTILKFRTMRVNSSGLLVTVRGDKRVSKVGAVLRATKLDEVPQFWNVLRGDMSLVGPRPEVEDFVMLYEERFRSVLSIRPGITDLASIYFRNEEEVLARSEDPLGTYRERILPMKLTFAERYVQDHSIFGDLAIIARTAIVTLCPSRSSSFDSRPT